MWSSLASSYSKSTAQMGTSQISKKRPANSQGGREPKKRQQEVSKRSVPVTKVVEEPVASSDEESEVAEEKENDDVNAMDVDIPAATKPSTSSGEFFKLWRLVKEVTISGL